jgi:hypothetical protein
MKTIDRARIPEQMFRKDGGDRNRLQGVILDWKMMMIFNIFDNFSAVRGRNPQIISLRLWEIATRFTDSLHERN